MKSYFRATICLSVLVLAGCASTGRLPLELRDDLHRARTALHLAQKTSFDTKKRIGYYLEAADFSSSELHAETGSLHARTIYNSALAGLTDFLQEQEEEAYWQKGGVFPSSDQKYTLRVNPGLERGVWRPEFFTDMVPAEDVSFKHVRRTLLTPGVGGTLVGVRQTAGPGGMPEAFEDRKGFLAPVSATLDFTGNQAQLTLWDPSVHPTVTVRGKSFPLAANHTAAIAYQPFGRQFWDGLWAMIQVDRFTGTSGLFMLQPYNPERIPVILVHGLASTSQMWFNVINEVESDPELRGEFQFWVFRYPTGNPVTLSAANFRRQLAELQEKYPGNGDMVLVGHSMGGLVSRLQAVDTGRMLWDANLKERADSLYAKFGPDSLLKRLLIFNANPDVGRLVFICVPHRGSEIALGTPGQIAMRLIRLPADLVQTATSTLGDVFRGDDGRLHLPTSITSLSPKNPTLLALDKLPIEAPHHSIIGDRGRGDTPDSSDGVVPYWSSHLDSAESELIVPGPHGSHQRQDTIEEMKRILRLHVGRE